MSFPQLGYQYIRPIYPPERQGIASNARSGTELSPSGALSNVLSTMYGSPFAAAAQGYGAFLPYSNDISIFNQLVSGSSLSRLIRNLCVALRSRRNNHLGPSGEVHRTFFFPFNTVNFVVKSLAVNFVHLCCQHLVKSGLKSRPAFGSMPARNLAC